MALDKDVLGLALYNIRNDFNNKQLNELLMMYTTLENARVAYAKKEAEVIINHFKNNALVTVNVNTTGTAAAQAGSGTGTIE